MNHILVKFGDYGRGSKIQLWIWLLVRVAKLYTHVHVYWYMAAGCMCHMSFLSLNQQCLRETQCTGLIRSSYVTGLEKDSLNAGARMPEPTGVNTVGGMCGTSHQYLPGGHSIWKSSQYFTFFLCYTNKIEKNNRAMVPQMVGTSETANTEWFLCYSGDNDTPVITLTI